MIDIDLRCDLTSRVNQEMYGFLQMDIKLDAINIIPKVKCPIDTFKYSLGINRQAERKSKIIHDSDNEEEIKFNTYPNEKYIIYKYNPDEILEHELNEDESADSSFSEIYDEFPYKRIKTSSSQDSEVKLDIKMPHETNIPSDTSEVKNPRKRRHNELDNFDYLDFDIC